MQGETKTRAGIALLIYSMTNAVIFGASLITVLSLPDLRDQGMVWIPVVVVASLILAAPIAWLVAPRLRVRYWQQQQSKERTQVMAKRHV